jgi:biotin carboxyl carrier protein
MRDALQPAELGGVVRVDEDERARFDAALRESGSLMPTPQSTVTSERVRALANFLSEGDVLRLRITRGDDEIELASRRRHASPSAPADRAEAAPLRVDTIKSDLVGIFHLGRPAPAEGEILDADRELGYIEALGIRTAVHSLGPGRLVAVMAVDEMPVEYGQPLFSIGRT